MVKALTIFKLKQFFKARMYYKHKSNQCKQIYNLQIQIKPFQIV